MIENCKCIAVNRQYLTIKKIYILINLPQGHDCPLKTRLNKYLTKLVRKINFQGGNI